MKRSVFSVAAISVMIIGGLSGLITCFASITSGIATCVYALILFLILHFFARVIDHLEKIRYLNESILAELRPDFRSQVSSPQIELTIPTIPAKDEKERNRVLEEIKNTGFTSTQKYDYKDYLIAIDENSRQWTVVTPNGEGSAIYSYDVFQGCKMNTDESNGFCAGVEVRVFIKGRPTDTIHIVLADRTGGFLLSYNDIKDEANKICEFLEQIQK